MIKEIRDRWIDGLKKYEQGNDYLCKDGKYCCMGVLAEVIQLPKEEKEGKFYYEGLCFNLSQERIKELGVSSQIQSALIFMNDNGISFEKIAEFIEMYL